jgi:hypothetical protein
MQYQLLILNKYSKIEQLEEIIQILSYLLVLFLLWNLAHFCCRILIARKIFCIFCEENKIDLRR